MHYDALVPYLHSADSQYKFHSVPVSLKPSSHLPKRYNRRVSKQTRKLVGRRYERHPDFKKERIRRTLRRTQQAAKQWQKSAVKWALKVILDQDFGPLNIDQRSILLKGYESNDRMIRLVNDLLDVDRIDSGRLEYQFGPTDLVNLIESVMVVLTPRITEQNVTIDFPGRNQQISKVRADTGKLRQVIQNLLDNAVKYSLKNGRVSVSLEERSREGVIAVSITDNGIGIPKDQQAKLFSKFFRADNARKLQTDGSGLGLYIMKQIVEKHGGAVTFVSEEGKGTTFTFTVPVYKSN